MDLLDGLLRVAGDLLGLLALGHAGELVHRADAAGEVAHGLHIDAALAAAAAAERQKEHQRRNEQRCSYDKGKLVLLDKLHPVSSFPQKRYHTTLYCILQQNAI